MALPFEFHWSGQNSDEASDITYRAVRWSAILDVAIELSGDNQCAFDGRYHAGGRHIVRRITVPARATTWLAKVPIVLASEPGRNWNSQRRFTMESEIATMIHISSKTNIPIPEVFGYDTSMEGNPAGLPFILMQCIQGNTVFDMGGPQILNSLQKTMVLESIASMQCQLLHAGVDQIGCLVMASNGGIDIGKLPQEFGLQGPFTQPADFFWSWVANNRTFKNLEQLADVDLKRATEAFPTRLASVIDKLTANNVVRNYPIVHPDLGMHNILLNNDYEVVGVIDWEGAYSAPIDVFAARTNMFASLDVDNGILAINAEGIDYESVIASMEKDDESIHVLLTALRSVVGGLSLCMKMYEEGRAMRFDRFIENIERGL
ncbi:hypothetical protein BN1708_013747 [Verticillium longisporum]|nr:hypothetical protein BN1708_013747 [Verticillium longisporum]